MVGKGQPHANKYKEIKNDWNHDASCTLTSHLIQDLENVKPLIFVVQSVQYNNLDFLNLNLLNFYIAFIDKVNKAVTSWLLAGSATQEAN
jgi:hypothetical protein